MSEVGEETEFGSEDMYLSSKLFCILPGIRNTSLFTLPHHTLTYYNTPQQHHHVLQPQPRGLQGLQEVATRAVGPHGAFMRRRLAPDHRQGRPSGCQKHAQGEAGM
jgi:hypothetical protein